MKRHKDGQSTPAGVPRLQEVGYTITYEDVLVTTAYLRQLKAEIKAADVRAKYGLFRTSLFYSNLRRWQRQGWHCEYENGPGTTHCTCGLGHHAARILAVRQPHEVASLVHRLDRDAPTGLLRLSLDAVEREDRHVGVPVGLAEDERRVGREEVSIGDAHDVERARVLDGEEPPHDGGGVVLNSVLGEGVRGRPEVHSAQVGADGEHLLNGGLELANGHRRHRADRDELQLLPCRHAAPPTW